MKKTLTEQWREGTLENGFYYVMSGWSTFIEIRYLGNGFFEGNIKVLAPVPSYEQFIGLMDDSKELDKAYDKITLLKKKLKIAKKALKEYMTFCRHPAEEALKEMKGVK